MRYPPYPSSYIQFDSFLFQMYKLLNSHQVLHNHVLTNTFSSPSIRIHSLVYIAFYHSIIPSLSLSFILLIMVRGRCLLFQYIYILHETLQTRRDSIFIPERYFIFFTIHYYCFFLTYKTRKRHSCF